MSLENRTGEELPMSSLPFRKRYTREMKDAIKTQSTDTGNGEQNLQSSETKNEKDQGENELVKIIPGVIRHTSSPDHSFAYYFNVPSKN